MSIGTFEQNMKKHLLILRFWGNLFCVQFKVWKKRVYVNRKSVNIEIQIFNTISESIVSDMEWTCTNRQNGSIKLIKNLRWLKKILKIKIDIRDVHTNI